MVAAVINLYAVPKHSYRILFYIGAGISLFAAIIRLALPESQYFIERSAAAKLAGTQISSAQKSKTFISEAGKALRLHWIRCIFAILLMTGFNFYSQFRLLLYTCMMLVADPWPPFPGSLAPAPSSPSLASLGSAPFVTPLLLAAPDATYLIMYSGSQDLYPVYVENGKGLSKHSATVATILGNCGAIVRLRLRLGFGNGLSQWPVSPLTSLYYTGWRVHGWLGIPVSRPSHHRHDLLHLDVLLHPLVAPPQLVPWAGSGSLLCPVWRAGSLVCGSHLARRDISGCLPRFLPWHREFFSALILNYTSNLTHSPSQAYQLGNMVSAASAQIETTAGDKIKTPEGLPDYGKVSAILIGVVSAWLIVCCIVGREDHGAHFERGKAAFEKGGGLDESELYILYLSRRFHADAFPKVDDRHDRLPELRGDEEKGSVAHEEKGQVQQREIA